MKFADYIYKSLTEDRGLKIHSVVGCSLCAEGLVASLGLRGHFWSFNRLNNRQSHHLPQSVRQRT